MEESGTISGYLDVKISARSRRGFTPWKAWQKQWCEIRRVDCIENGVQLKLKSSKDGGVLNTILIPRSAKICRTESRTKQYSFGIFTLGRNQKPLLFLSGSSETDSQSWMASIRKMLTIASYLPVGESNFHVSLVDNQQSRAAGLMGLHGVLGINSQEIVISDPCTGEPKVCWKWYQFHQFHLQASTIPCDEKKICVMHSSGDFPSGQGQIYLYCNQAPQLLSYLVSRGKRPKPYQGLLNAHRLSRSEGDLYETYSKDNKDRFSPDPACFRSNSGSEDSGVRVSITSDDFVLKNKMAASLISIGIGILAKTPGGSETGDSLLDLTASDQENTMLRRESGVSLASGVYEEISETPPPKKDTEPVNHVYEDPILVSLKIKTIINPPPLPPRQNGLLRDSEVAYTVMVPYKHRCNTLPAKDLQRMSQIFTSDEDYIVMSPSKKPITDESFYTPMSSMTQIKTKFENYYMVMGGTTKSS